MAYSHTNSKGVTYFLHSKKVILKGGREQTIYYFAKAVNPETELNDLPDAYMVKESARTGLPILAKKPVA